MLENTVKTTSIEVSSYDACGLAYAARKQLSRVEKELAAMRMVLNGSNSHRLAMPETMRDKGVDEIRENINHWCSEVMFWRHWVDQFESLQD